MNAEQIAVYLDEHPEFFNDYPDLLEKIKTIQVPSAAKSTLSITGRIVNKLQNENAELKEKVVTLIDLTKVNDQIIRDLFEIERVFMISLNLQQLMRHTEEEIFKRFNIHQFFLVLDESLKIEFEKSNDLPPSDKVLWQDPTLIQGWFDHPEKSVIISDFDHHDLKAHFSPEIKSVAQIPLLIRNKWHGAIFIGSNNSGHFHEDLRNDLIENMSLKMGVVLDNILITSGVKSKDSASINLERIKTSLTERLVSAELEQARRHHRSIALIQIHIDIPDPLVNTSNIDDIRQAFDKTFANSRKGTDLIVEKDDLSYCLFLQDLDKDKAAARTKQLKKNTESLLKKKNLDWPLVINMDYFPQELIETTSHGFEQALRDVDLSVGSKPCRK